LQRRKQNSLPGERHPHHCDERNACISPDIQKRSARHGGTGANYAIKDLACLAEHVPDAYRQLIASETTRRRLEWAGLLGQIISHLCGLAALSMLCAVSWHAIDRGAFTQGASIICTGAVSIVALFVTGRVGDRRYERRPRADRRRRPSGTS
jgi:hypothetical protein